MPKAGAITPRAETTPGARVALAVALWFAVAPARAEIVEINFGPRLLKAEVAATPAAREQGLMRRPALPENQGMLFVFPEPGRVCMWMKDTLIPLSVAFMDAQGRIINISDMQPGSLAVHCAEAPARYALEMNRGWFAKRSVQAGDIATGIGGLAVR